MIKETNFTPCDREDTQRLGQVYENAYDDPETRRLTSRLIRIAFMAEAGDQEKILRIYSQCVLGVEIPTPWTKVDPQSRYHPWLEQIGKNSNGVGELPKDGGINFWQEFDNQFPSILTEKDLVSLKLDTNGAGGFLLAHFMTFRPRTPLLAPIMNSIHAWK